MKKKFENGTPKIKIRDIIIKKKDEDSKERYNEE